MVELDDERQMLFAKLDVKDGLWQLVCEVGNNWNFCHVLLQEDGKSTRLIV